jgi:Tfp pilus assembly protein PilF
MYARALELEPSHVGALVNLGSLLAAENLTDTAQELFSRALTAEPQAAGALNNYALCLYQRTMRAHAAVSKESYGKVKDECQEGYYKVSLVQLTTTD